MTAPTQAEIIKAVDNAIVAPDWAEPFWEAWQRVGLWNDADFRPATERTPCDQLIDAAAKEAGAALREACIPILLQLAGDIAERLPDLPRAKPKVTA